MHKAEYEYFDDKIGSIAEFAEWTKHVLAIVPKFVLGIQLGIDL